MAEREREPCSAYADGKCRNGFPAHSPICWGHLQTNVKPHCQREEWCAFWFEPWGGKPPLQKSTAE
jgi:hypothetical protein